MKLANALQMLLEAPALAATVLLIVCTIQTARAGPPFVTDDPEPVEYHHYELYLYSTYDHAAGSDSASGPAVEFNYGVIPDVQLHLISQVQYARPADDGAHFGPGDTELGIKYRFVHESDSLPQVGVFPLVELPTGDQHRDLGNGKTQVFLPVWIQKSFGPWTTYGGGGFWYNPGQDHRNYSRLGWELQRDDGFLPPGVHPATLAEIRDRFGGPSEIQRTQMESIGSADRSCRPCGRCQNCSEWQLRDEYH